MTGWQFWIDRGGSFTDIVAQSPAGILAPAKLGVDGAADDDVAVLAAMRRLMGLRPDQDVPAGAVTMVRLATSRSGEVLAAGRGDPLALVVTAGFADLFAAFMPDPPLYARVVEVAERVGADGRVLRALDDDSVTEQLRRLRADGVVSLAVVLMHACRHPAHERRIGHLAAASGFEQVSLSHQVSPAPGLAGRGTTTIVDAHLAPVLRRQALRLVAPLDGARLAVMHGGGGLAEFRRLSAKDSVLSAPAAAMVAAIGAAARAGFDRLLGFDMGGGATATWQVVDALDRRAHVAVAGIGVRGPMLDIDTVAMGGDSVVELIGGRLCLGPAVAPGRAFGGGRVTVSDAAVVAGRLWPELSPAVAGPAVDRAAARSGLTELAARLGADLSPEQLAGWILAIAAQGMADAILGSAAQRGHDTDGFVLVCAGGAAGQHACQVAAAAGLETVVVPPLAGVAGAQGLGQAPMRLVRERGVEVALDAANQALFNRVLADLEAEARCELERQGVDRGDMSVRRVARLRLEGAERAWEVEFTGIDAMAAAFAERHRLQVGVALADPPPALTVEAIMVEMSGLAEPTLSAVAAAAAPATAGPPDRVAMTCPGRECQPVPLFGRDDLRPGRSVDGPAIIADSTTTIVVDPGWRALAVAGGALVLCRIVDDPERPQLPASADPLSLGLFTALGDGVVARMEAVAAHVAASTGETCPPVPKRGEGAGPCAGRQGCAPFDAVRACAVRDEPRACAIFAADGMVMAASKVGATARVALDHAVGMVLERVGDLRPGQSFVVGADDDRAAATVVTPVFAGTVLPSFLVATRAALPGGSGPRSGVAPAAEADPDLHAQLSANRYGVAAMTRHARQFGIETMSGWMAQAQAWAVARVQAAVARMDDAVFVAPMADGTPLKVSVCVDRQARTARVDFTGTGPARPGGVGATAAVTRAAVSQVVALAAGLGAPLGRATMAALDIVVPAGSVLAVDAAAAQCPADAAQAVVDLMMAAVNVRAGAQGGVATLVLERGGHRCRETLRGGGGGGAGLAGMTLSPADAGLADPETMEDRLPVLVEMVGIRRGSGGAGLWHGGDGLSRRLTALAPLELAVHPHPGRLPAFGVMGGDAGLAGAIRVERADGGVEAVAGQTRLTLAVGDVLVVETPGGGGWGQPARHGVPG